jgi:hypothetical protein
LLFGGSFRVASGLAGISAERREYVRGLLISLRAEYGGFDILAQAR